MTPYFDEIFDDVVQISRYFDEIFDVFDEIFDAFV